MRRNEWESWIVEQLGVERCDVGKSLFHTPQWRSRKIAKWHQAWHPMLFCLSGLGFVSAPYLDHRVFCSVGGIVTMAFGYQYNWDEARSARWREAGFQVLKDRLPATMSALAPGQAFLVEVWPLDVAPHTPKQWSNPSVFPDGIEVLR